jgi:hypothetical protein
MELKNLKYGIRMRRPKPENTFDCEDGTNEKKRWGKIYEYDWCKSG